MTRLGEMLGAEGFGQDANKDTAGNLKGLFSFPFSLPL
jgi:hypothetical protein